MSAPVASSPSPQNNNRSRQMEQQRAAAQQQAQQAAQAQQQQLEKQSTTEAAPTAEIEAKRGRVSGEVQTATRERTQAVEQTQRDRVMRGDTETSSQPAVKKGIEAQAASDPAPKVDPKKQPVMVLAPQFGNGESDEIVKNSYEKVKANAEKNGFKVIDAPNLTGEELKKKVASEIPEGHTGPVVAWTGGHGSVAQDKGENKTEHEITASDKDGESREARTGEDILRPIYDGAKEASGNDPKMTAFVGSCRAGEAANDLKETFSKEEQKSLAVVTSSGRDQLSNGESSQGVESATLAFTDMMAKDSKTRAAADQNRDGEVSANEFVNHVNTDGGGLAVAREKDLDDDKRPDEIQIDSQKLEVAGAGDNPLVPKGTGKDGWDASAGPMGDPNRPTTKAQATEQAKEIQKYLAGIYGQTPKIVDNPKTAGGIDATYDKGGKSMDQGNVSIRENDDGSKVIKAGSKAEGYEYEENVAPGGKTGSYSVTDGKGNVLEKGKTTYDEQGRMLTKEATELNSPWMAGQKTTHQYDDKTKPYSSEVIKQKDGLSITTHSYNDPKVQGPWHDNDIASTKEVKGADGKTFEKTTTYNRPDTEEGKPYTASQTEYIDPNTGKPVLTKSSSSSSKEPDQWTGPDGKRMTEAQVRKGFPWMFPN